ncbi:MAG TPA: thermonuclease family protein [Candidatus Saccharimonadales bacterium]|nr:thermonuclease family protein [Candidatus Saccharimonadales bacterium]
MKLKKRQIRLLVTLLIAALGALSVLTTPAKQQITQAVQTQNPGLYQVDHAVDGDTIVVKSGDKTETVRFIGVDTPEEKDRRKPVQCYAQQAADFTKQQVENHQVRLEADSQGDNRDRYGRMLRYVYLSDGTLLNKKLVEDGYGFAMTGFPFSKMSEFQAAGQQAQAQRKGAWGSCTISMATGYPQTNPL